MKKLFTSLALALLTLMAANAQTAPVPVHHLTSAAGAKIVKHADAQAPSMGHIRTASTHYWPTSEYKSLGKGSMTDEMVTAIYQYKPVTFEVEIQQCVAEPAFYRIIAPYGKAFADAMLATNGVQLKEGQYDSKDTCVINIDLTDPTDGYMPKSYIGCDWGYGPMYLGLPTTGKLEYKDGVITAPRRGIAVGDDEGATAQNVNQHFRIVLPGYNPTDYRLELTDCSSCVTERKFSATAVVGNDIALVKYYVFPNQAEDEMSSLLPAVTSDGADFTPRGAFSYEMDNVAKETIVMVGFNADGTAVANNWFSYYYVGDEDAADWQDVGTATFTDGLLSSIYKTEIVSHPCTLQQHKYRPGYLRLVNPYAQSPYAQDRYTHKGHNHYIYVVADDPQAIYLEESPIGLDFGHGTCRIWSQTGYWLNAGEDIADLIDMGLCAAEEDGVISFDDEQLLFSAIGYDNGDWYYAKAGTKIELPADFSLGIDGIGIDNDNNAPVEYYNLQGVRINPAAAAPGLYIRRQGTTTAKTLLR